MKPELAKRAEEMIARLLSTPPKFFIIEKITRKADGSRLKRPVFKRDGKVYKTLKAAKENH